MILADIYTILGKLCFEAVGGLLKIKVQVVWKHFSFHLVLLMFKSLGYISTPNGVYPCNPHENRCLFPYRTDL